jgi:hypothetical protein
MAPRLRQWVEATFFPPQSHSQSQVHIPMLAAVECPFSHNEMAESLPDQAIQFGHLCLILALVSRYHDWLLKYGHINATRYESNLPEKVCSEKQSADSHRTSALQIINTLR